MDMTPKQANDLIILLHLGGLRPPDVAASPEGRAAQAKLYATILSRAGLSFEDASAAVETYLGEPHPPSGFPKAFPDPGALIARTPRGRAMLAIGGDADADAAWTDFWRALNRTAFRPDRDDPSRHLDPVDPWRNDAMFLALKACGGAVAVGTWPDPPPPGARAAFRAAYIAARKPHATVQEAVTLALPAPARPMLSVLK